MKMSSEFIFSKKGKRKLTPFLGKELLYDYISNRLDDERKRAVDSLLKDSKEIQDEVLMLKRAMSYTEELAQTGISEKIIDEIKVPKTYIQGFFQKIRWSEWPSGLKLGIEVLTVASCILLVIILIPWNKVIKFPIVQTSQLVLSEVKKDISKSSSNEIVIAEKNATPEELVFQDETEKTAESVNNQKTVQAQAPVKTDSKSVNEASKNNTKPQPESIKTQGFLYRGSIRVSNLDVTSEKFVKKIEEFGGRKAGEVPLGWKKGESTYFHFTIPEAKYESLKSFLIEYGKIQLNKEKHDRVMPDGIIRIIINVYEDKDK